jgi:ATP-dependent DNA helicase RecG
MTNQDGDSIPDLLDVDAFYNLLNEPMPQMLGEVRRRFQTCGLIRDNLEGKFDITNLGAILLARDITKFPSVSGKSVRIVSYAGRDKSKSDYEREANMGYAAGFANMTRWQMHRIPKEERYVNGVRRSTPRYPEIAISREPHLAGRRRSRTKKCALCSLLGWRRGVTVPFSGPLM